MPLRADVISQRELTQWLGSEQPQLAGELVEECHVSLVLRPVQKGKGGLLREEGTGAREDGSLLQEEAP